MTRDLPRLVKKFHVHLEPKHLAADGKSGGSANGTQRLDCTVGYEWWQRAPYLANYRDIQDVPVNLVIAALLDFLDHEFLCSIPSGSDSAAGTTVTESSQLPDFASIQVQLYNEIDDYLLRRFGENGRVVTVLKAASNQSIVLAAVAGLRALFEQSGLHFRDSRGSWHVHIFKQLQGDQMLPSIVQQRWEQVFADNTGLKDEFGFDKIANLYKFCWQIEIVFASLSCDRLHSISIRLVDIEFTLEDNPLFGEAFMQEARRKCEQIFATCGGTVLASQLERYMNSEEYMAELLRRLDEQNGATPPASLIIPMSATTIPTSRNANKRSLLLRRPILSLLGIGGCATMLFFLWQKELLYGWLERCREITIRWLPSRQRR